MAQATGFDKTEEENTVTFVAYAFRDTVDVVFREKEGDSRLTVFTLSRDEAVELAEQLQRAVQFVAPAEVSR